MKILNFFGFLALINLTLVVNFFTLFFEKILINQIPQQGNLSILFHLIIIVCFRLYIVMQIFFTFFEFTKYRKSMDIENINNNPWLEEFRRFLLLIHEVSMEIFLDFYEDSLTPMKRGYTCLVIFSVFSPVVSIFIFITLTILGVLFNFPYPQFFHALLES